MIVWVKTRTDSGRNHVRANVIVMAIVSVRVQVTLIMKFTIEM